MNNELTDIQKKVLGHALFRYISYGPKETEAEIYEIAKKLDVFKEMAKAAYIVIAEIDRKITENYPRKEKDDDKDNEDPVKDVKFD